MLSHDELSLHCEKHNLSGQAQSIVNRVRATDPARRVRSAFGQKLSRYPSRKMGFSLQAEGDAQFAMLMVWEHDDRVYEVWDQPPAINIEVPAKSGKPTAYTFSPSYFVISSDFIGWVEVWSEKRLTTLADKSPNRYQRDKEGNWRSPPGEQYAQQFGLGYRIRSSAAISSAHLRNIQYLADYYRDDCPPIEDDVVSTVIDLVSAEPGILLCELFDRLPNIKKDHVFTLIAQEHVYVDLQNDPIPEPDLVRCFRDALTAQAYAIINCEEPQEIALRLRTVKIALDAQIDWDGRPWRIGNIGDTTTTLFSLDNTNALAELPNAQFESLIRQGKICGIEQGELNRFSAEAKEIWAHASETDHRKALQHLRIIKPDLEKRLPTSDELEEYESTPKRTRTDWKAKYRYGQEIYGSGYIGLLSKTWKQGNRQAKIPNDTQDVIDEYVGKYYQPKRPPKHALYLQLRNACQEAGIAPPGYKAFQKAIKARETYPNSKNREGHRAAYDQKPSSDFFWFLGPEGDCQIECVSGAPFDIRRRTDLRTEWPTGSRYTPSCGPASSICA